MALLAAFPRMSSFSVTITFGSRLLISSLIARLICFAMVIFVRRFDSCDFLWPKFRRLILPAFSFFPCLSYFFANAEAYFASFLFRLIDLKPFLAYRPVLCRNDYPHHLRTLLSVPRRRR